MNIDELFQDNLIQPKTFDTWGEVGKFVRDNRCALCLRSLVPDFAPNRKYIAKCPEHGEIYEHTFIHRSKAEKVKDGELTGAFELRR